LPISPFVYLTERFRIFFPIVMAALEAAIQAARVAAVTTM
jgi:hypothetical protein